jgi:outer membrane biosynthesis protein TonB
LDTLVKNFGTAESVVRRKLEDEAAAKDTDEEDKKTADDEDGKEESDETGEKDEASDDDEKAEADKEEDGDKSEEEDKEKEGADEDVEDKDKDKDSKKKKKDKKKKDKKKKKKDKKKKIKKKPEIKVNKKAVAQAVLDKSCSAKDFESVKTIGSYPGRRYDNYGTSSSSYSTSSKSKKKTKASKDSGKLARACKTFVADHGDWIKQKLASPSSKDYKGMKKIKRDFCEKKNKMCKSAALGFEAESACLAKALRAATAGEFEKASKLAAKCPKVKSA